MIIAVMGVSGCGKTTVGEALAQSLSWRFMDADDFHPPANVAKMAAGTPLNDDDRWPWLDRIVQELQGILARGDNAVLACSALKQAYRDRLQRAGDVRLVHLRGDYDTIAARLAQRKHRYMPSALLTSQFATLEAPNNAVNIDVGEPVASQVASIRAAYGLTSATTS